MPTFFAIALLSGIICAGLHASAMSGAAGAGILSLLSPAPLFFAALSAGPLAGAAAAGVAALGISILQGKVASAVFLVMWGFPAALAGGIAAPLGVLDVPQARARQLSRAMDVLSACGAFFVLLAVAFLGGMTGWASPAQKIASLLDAQVLEASSQLSLPPEAVSEVFRKISEFLPGLAFMAWLLLMLAAMVIAQGVFFRRRCGNGADVSFMAGLRLPRWVFPCFAAALVAGVFGRGIVGFAGMNLACFLLVPFFMDGLGVVHALAFRHGRRARVLVWFLYGSLLMFNVLAIPVAGLGMMDQWSDLRRKWANRLPGRESE